jgi:hypothetical protein
MVTDESQLDSEFDFDFSTQESLLDLVTGDAPSFLEISEEIQRKWSDLLRQTDGWKEKIKAHKDSFIREQRSKLMKKLYAQKTLRLRDKVSFVLGVSYIWCTTIMLAKFPSWMPHYHICTTVPLIVLRWFIYKSKKWHYFLADLCYFVNLFMIFYHFAFPSSRFLFSAIFTLANGPVAWAIYAWRNALVFHSLDKMTSIAIHISPALTLYATRWLADPMKNPWFTYNPVQPDTSTSLWMIEMIATSTFVYVLWQAWYAYFILVQRADKVYNRSHATSFTWMLADYMKNKKESMLAQLFSKLPAWGQPLMFMALNFGFAIVTSIPTIFYYRSFWLHTIFIIAMVLVSTYNGASYYVEVFSHRYTIELERLEQAAKELHMTDKEKLE